MRIIGGILCVFGALTALQVFSYDSFFYDLIWLTIGAILIYAGASLIENKQKRTGNNSTRMIDYYWNLEREIFEQCFNNKTTIFDWDKWFDRRDEIIHTAPESVLLDIDSEFRHCGTTQIYYINAIINNWILSTSPFDPSAGITKLQRDIRDTGILLNIPSMYSFRRAVCDRKNCPDEVEKYCSMLNNVLYGRKPATRQIFENIVQLGINICG